MPEPASTVPAGELAAVLASTLWAAASLLFTGISRRTGPSAVNQFRLFGGTAVLGAAWLVLGVVQGFDDAPPARQTLALLVSGVVGLALGDGALFRAYHILGARRVSLIGALAPVFVAILAAPLLGERIGFVGAAGMAVTLAGILWVVADRTPDGGTTHGSVGAGMAFAVLAAVGQAVGAILTKAGLGLAAPGSPLGDLLAADAPPEPVPALTAVMLRMSVGAAALAVWTVPTGRIRDLGAFRDRRLFGLGALSMFLGTCCGVTLSLVAFARTETAVAQTLLSLTPVLILPMARIFTPDRPPWRAWAGALVACGGVALLAFRHRLWTE